MKSYHRQGECEFCQSVEAEIFAEGYWLCFDCESDMANDHPRLLGLELASLVWGCQAEFIRGGRYESQG